MLRFAVFRFVLAGMANTILSYAIFSVLFYSGVSPYYSSSIGYFFALCFSFFVNKNFVFKSYYASTMKLVMKFVSFNFSMLALNLTILHVMMVFFELGGYLSQGIALVFTAGLSFIFYRLIFRYEA